MDVGSVTVYQAIFLILQIQVAANCMGDNRQETQPSWHIAVIQAQVIPTHTIEKILMMQQG